MRVFHIFLCSALLVFTFLRVGLAAQSEIELEQQLRADHDAYVKAVEDLASRTSRGELGNAEIADYSSWIEQLGNRIGQGCLALQKASTGTVPDDLPCARYTGLSPAQAKIDIVGENTVSERTENMVDELDTALGAFDEQLLKEQDKIKAQTPRSDSSQDYSGAQQGSGKQSGSADDSGEIQESSSARNDKVASSDKATGDKPSSEYTESGNTPGNESQASIPDDIPDGSDDDVVARQLREAAEKETDPELKEKLWEEYRRYKAG